METNYIKHNRVIQCNIEYVQICDQLKATMSCQNSFSEYWHRFYSWNWNCTGWMNGVLPKDIPTVGVFNDGGGECYQSKTQRCSVGLRSGH